MGRLVSLAVPGRPAETTTGGQYMSPTRQERPEADAVQHVAILRDLYSQLAANLSDLTCRPDLWAQVKAEQDALDELAGTTTT